MKESIGYQYSIEKGFDILERKGGPGSGIRGHRTNRLAAKHSREERFSPGKIPEKDFQEISSQVKKWGGLRSLLALQSLGRADRSEIHLLRIGKEVKGIASVRVEGNNLIGDNLATKEGGFGRQMMNSVFKSAAEKNLGLSFMSSDGAIGFHRKFGMTEIVRDGDSYFSLTAAEVKQRTKGIDELEKLEPKNGVFIVSDKSFMRGW